MTENKTFAEHTQIQLYNTKNYFGSERDKVQKKHCKTNAAPIQMAAPWQ